MKIYRCDRTYLALALGIRLAIATAIGVVLYIFASHALGIAAGLLIAIVSVVRWFIKRTYRFTVADQFARTEKLFTKDLDVTTPILNVQGVSAYEGIIEALCGVGTVEISTASSNGDHVTFRWPYIRDHRQVVGHLKSECEAARRRT